MIKDHFACVGALILREMSTRYGRSPGGYIWAFLEPLGMILILGFGWSLLARSPSMGTSHFLFIATGYVILHMFTSVAGLVGKAMTFSKSLLQYPRVIWFDALVARFVLNVLVVVVVAFIILTAILQIEGIRSALDWQKIFVALGLTAWLGFSVGSLNCYFFQRIPVWERLWAILTRPLFIVSGVVITYEEMPQQAQNALWFNPVLHLVGIMRDGFYPLYRPDYISYPYLMIWLFIPLIFGLMKLLSESSALLNR